MRAILWFGVALTSSAVLLPDVAPAQQAPQVKVQVDDLDLTKDAGVRTANNRLKSSVEGHCTAGGRDLRSLQDEQVCKNDLLTKGHGKIAAAAAKSDADKLAEQRHLAEVSIHPRRVRRATAYHMTQGHAVVARHPAPHKTVRHPAIRHPAAGHHAKTPLHRKR